MWRKWFRPAQVQGNGALGAATATDSLPVLAGTGDFDTPAREAGLVFDIGMHTGVDTEFYLRKGFRVVAVEANPLLVARAEKEFARHLESGRLIIEPYGIHDDEGTLTFYANEDCDEWSSFHEHLGTRQNTRFRQIDVPCRRLSHFLEKHGMPHLLKIDVEGMDAAVARQLRDVTARPRYVSVEDGGIDSLIALYEIGVRRFQFSNQLDIRELAPCEPAREGESVPLRFGESSSGPFGLELPGEWLDAAEAFAFYGAKVRPPGQEPINGWWDIHGDFERAG